MTHIAMGQERSRLTKTVDGVRNIDWVYTTPHPIETVLAAPFLVQLFAHRNPIAGDRLRIVADDAGEPCFVDMIILAVEKGTGFLTLADMTAPGRSYDGVTIRKLSRPEPPPPPADVLEPEIPAPSIIRTAAKPVLRGVEVN